MQKIYQNFDGLDVSFQCALPVRLLKRLAEAQAEAQSTRQPTIIELGNKRRSVEVAENGMKGGYAFRFDTGPDGAIWAVANNEFSNRWNVRVSVKSLCLALHGYEKTKEQMLDFLIHELGAIAPEGEDSPIERVSRFDYCVDFLATEPFTLNPKHFLAHNKSKRKFFSDIRKKDSEPLVCVDQGKSTQTVTIGKMPNRQLTVYNKRLEIQQSRKIYWWNLWGLNPEEIKSDIWRVEIRAGKKELNRYQLRRFSDFEEKAGDVILNILRDYRYIIPNPDDKNRSRWPMAPFWKITINSVKQDLFDYICGAERSDIIEGQQKAILERYKSHIFGTITSYTAAQGKDIAELPEVIDGIYKDFGGEIHKNPQKFQKNHEKAEKRFAFLKIE